MAEAHSYSSQLFAILCRRAGSGVLSLGSAELDPTVQLERATRHATPGSSLIRPPRQLVIITPSCLIVTN